MTLRWALLTAAICFLLDQGSKAWVLSAYEFDGVRSHSVLFGVNFVRSYNTGVNFGLFAGDGATQRVVLIAIALSISAGLLIWAARRAEPAIGAAAGAIVGGALANAYDRWTIGAVHDFLNLDCCGIGNPFAFNLADTAIFVGAAALIWLTWSDEDRAPASQDASADKSRRSWRKGSPQ